MGEMIFQSYDANIHVPVEITLELVGMTFNYKVQS